MASFDAMAPGKEADFETILSLQLWSLRHLGDLEAQLAAAADAGYRLVEPIGAHLQEIERLKAGLAKNNLSAPSGHIGMADLRTRLSETVDACGQVGMTRLYMPAFSEVERVGDAEHWRSLGRELGEVATRLAENGITLGYHNHFWEFDVLDNGETALANLFAGAEGTPLAWQADIAWIARGGADPVAFMERYASILNAAHVKDQAPEGEKADEDGWCDVGTGILDWPKLWEQARRFGAEYMVVEHDNPADPFAFAANSHAYLARMARSGN
ncbi:sugar phosphate isomerase/epimerase family protein [Martelella mediterranea]|uniref:Xylose isomerase-like TIM barrel n=1 Tax=Martelella mediterranea DSM 17316 TaxID=1122214 RepID=A0A1U9ZAE7_9HYPH|nr:sugar phosphate isomerase/epimerase [Martelella mediterranea]AQZ54552.1 Xylose isomerase-like TIM barrel [Martelella mediterranea DSM 17316]